MSTGARSLHYTAYNTNFFRLPSALEAQSLYCQRDEVKKRRSPSLIRGIDLSLACLAMACFGLIMDCTRGSAPLSRQFAGFHSRVSSADIMICD